MWALQLLQRLHDFLRRICSGGLDRVDMAQTTATAAQPLCAAAQCRAVKSLVSSNSEPGLLDEIWLSVLSFANPAELSRRSELDHRFKTLANDDDLWRQLCRARWIGKQWMPDELFRNGDYKRVSLSVAEAKSILKKRDISVDNIVEKSELLEVLRSSNPKVQGAPLVPPSGSKWKVSFVYSELDSLRKCISTEEVAYFRWHLVYHGRPSQMGLRHFQKNGIFVSPHFGETRWSLAEGGTSFIMHGVAPLQVQRNSENWGWVIGAGTGTEYHSRELEN